MITHSDVSKAETSLLAATGGRHCLLKMKAVSSHQETTLAPESVLGGDAQVRGLRAASAEKLLSTIFEGKCVDLKLKPLKERRERFLHKIRSQSSHGVVCMRDSGLGPFAGAAVAAMLQKHRCSDLDLTGNMIRDKGATALAEMLCTNRHLTSLTLQSNDIGIDGAASIFAALSSNSALTALDLGSSPTGGNRNRSGLKSVEALTGMLEKNCSLTRLSLYGNGMGPECCTALAQGLRCNTTLKELDIGVNGIADGGLASLCASIDAGCHVQQLCLSQNGLTDKGGVSIAGPLQTCEVLLQTLDLSNNKLGPEAATALGNALSCNSVLTSLRLEHNVFGEEGGTGFAVGLASRTLTQLNLSDNELRDKGSAAIAKMLDRSPALRTLDLRHNVIGDVGGVALAQALKDANTSLTCLNLENNSICDHAGVCLAKALASNSSLLTLSLKANLIHDTTGAELVAGLCHNTSLTELDVSWTDIKYGNLKSISLLIAAAAKRYAEGAVERLNGELKRLRRMEPRLAVREAELNVLLGQLEHTQLDSKRMKDECQEMNMTTEEKLEEMKRETAVETAKLLQRKEEVAVAVALLEEKKKIDAAAQGQKMKTLKLKEDEVLQIRNKILRLQNNLAQVGAEIDEAEAEFRDSFQELADQKEHLEREKSSKHDLIHNGLNYVPTPEIDRLILTVYEADGLPLPPSTLCPSDPDALQSAPPYCLLRLQGTDHMCQTRCMQIPHADTASPQTRESTTWKAIFRNCATLKIEVWEKEGAEQGEGSGEFYGYGILDLTSYYDKALRRTAGKGVVDKKGVSTEMLAMDAADVLGMSVEQVMAVYDADASGVINQEDIQEIQALVDRVKNEDGPRGAAVMATELNTVKINVARKGMKQKGCVRLRVQAVASEH